MSKYNTWKLYETLGLKKENNPSQAEIKKAYRQMALKWHPDSFDRGNSSAKTKEEAEEKFKKINHAHETLSDPDKKREYDLYGDEGKENSSNSYSYEYKDYSYSSYNFDWDKWKRENDAWWNEYYKDQKERREKWDKEDRERDAKWLKEKQDSAISYLIKELLRKNVPAQKLNAQLGVSDWRTKITEITDKWNVNSIKWDINDIIDLLSREFTCESCGKTRNDLYYPSKLDGKNFCDWDCKEVYRKKNSKDESFKKSEDLKGPGGEKSEIYDKEKEICENCFKKYPAYEKRAGENLCAGCQRTKENKELKNEVKKLREYLDKKLGNGEQTVSKNRFGGKTTTKIKKNPIGELIEWVRKEGITNIRLDLNSNQLVIEFSNNNSKTLNNNELSPEQKELRNFFIQNPDKRNVSRSEIEEMGGENIEGQNLKTKNDNNKLVTGLIVAGVILMVVVVIGVVIYKNNRKKNY